MTYAIKSTGNNTFRGYELVEVTRAQLRKLEAAHAADESAPDYAEIDFRRAHQWVRNGKLHSTGLWIDDEGKIRK